MTEPKEDLAIDIGGGFGEFFVEEARKRPNTQFLILEPRPLRLRRFPPNLHVVRWASDVDWTIPLVSESVDEANINFLMGEMMDRSGSIGTGETVQLERYQNLLHDLKRTLKNGAILSILEPSNNVEHIENILYKEGYHIVDDPQPLKEVERTAWSKRFHDWFKESGKSQAESVAYPWIIKARK